MDLVVLILPVTKGYVSFIQIKGRGHYSYRSVEVCFVVANVRVNDVPCETCVNGSQNKPFNDEQLPSTNVSNNYL